MKRYYKFFDLENIIDTIDGVTYKEEWKPVIGYEEYYQVSNFGRIKSLAKEWVTLEKFGVRRKDDSIIRQGEEKSEYLRVIFCVDKKKKAFNVHRIVAEHFCENPDNLPWVNHENSIRWFNFYKNLNWTTASGNRLHGLTKGFIKPKKGEDHPLSVLKEKDVLEIRELYKNKCATQTEIAKMFNVNQTQISRIVLGKRWFHLK